MVDDGSGEKQVGRSGDHYPQMNLAIFNALLLLDRLLPDMADRGIGQNARGPIHVRTVLRRRQLHHPLQLPPRRTSGTHHLHVVRALARDVLLGSSGFAVPAIPGFVFV